MVALHLTPSHNAKPSNSDQNRISELYKQTSTASHRPMHQTLFQSEMQRVLVSSSPSRARVRMSRVRVRVQMRRTRFRVQQVSSPSPSPGFCVSSPNPSPEEKNWRALARGIFHNIIIITNFALK